LETIGENIPVLSTAISCQPGLILWARATDRDLVQWAQAGEDAAFGELWKRYAAMMQRVAHRILKNREDAEDTAQDALMRAYRHIGNFDGRSSFSTWLTQITINSSLMVLRRRRTRNEVSLDADPDYTAWVYNQASSPEDDPETAFAERQMAGMLYSAIGQLPAKLRMAMWIRHANDLPIKEVAERTGITVAATKSRLNRASRSIELLLKRRMARVRAPQSQASAR